MEKLRAWGADLARDLDATLIAKYGVRWAELRRAEVGAYVAKDGSRYVLHTSGKQAEWFDEPGHAAFLASRRRTASGDRLD